MRDIDLKKAESKMYEYIIGFHLTTSEKLLIKDFFNYFMNAAIAGDLDE